MMAKIICNKSKVFEFDSRHQVYRIGSITFVCGTKKRNLKYLLCFQSKKVVKFKLNSPIFKMPKNLKILIFVSHVDVVIAKI